MPNSIAIELRQEQQFTHDARPNLLAAMIICIVLAYLGVGLRMVARWKARAKLRADDWFILGGLATATGFLTASFLMVKYGLGIDIQRVEQKQTVEPFVKSVISAQVLYSLSIIPIKISILCLYHRLFPSRRLYKISIATGVFIACYAISQALCMVLQCIPMSSLWTHEPAQCIDLNAMLTTMSVLNVSTDFILVALPIPFLWNLKIDTSRRLQLIGTFLLGGTVCVFGILRSVFVGTADPANPSRSYATGVMWSVLEVCVGIVSACLPTLRPLFKARTAKVPTGSNGASGHHYGSHSRSATGKDFGGIQLSSKIKPSSTYRSEDRHPFAKLDGFESGDDTQRSRTRSSADLHEPPRSRAEVIGVDGKQSRTISPNGMIMVTTDIRIQEDENRERR